MWFATRDGLNRYAGYTFVVYKHDPNDPGSLSSNLVQDLARGQSRISMACHEYRGEPIRSRDRTLYPLPPRLRQSRTRSVGAFGQERGPGPGRVSLVRYRRRRSRQVRSSARNVTHYREDSEGRFVGRIAQVIEDRHRDIWFIGNRGLFHVDQDRGRSPALRRGNRASAPQACTKTQPGMCGCWPIRRSSGSSNMIGGQSG